MDKETLIKLHNIYDNMILGNIKLAHKELGIIIKEENKDCKCLDKDLIPIISYNLFVGYKVEYDKCSLCGNKYNVKFDPPLN